MITHLAIEQRIDLARKLPNHPAIEPPATEMASAGARSVRIRRPLCLSKGAHGVSRPTLSCLCLPMPAFCLSLPLPGRRRVPRARGLHHSVGLFRLKTPPRRPRRLRMPILADFLCTPFLHQFSMPLQDVSRALQDGH